MRINRAKTRTKREKLGVENILLFDIDLKRVEQFANEINTDRFTIHLKIFSVKIRILTLQWYAHLLLYI